MRRSVRLYGAPLLLLGLAGGSTARAEDKAEVGRYELTALGEFPVMFDTTTGECWADWRGQGWASCKFPVKETKGTKGACGRFRLRTTKDKLIVWDTHDGRSWRSSEIDVSEAPLPDGGPEWTAKPSPRPK